MKAVAVLCLIGVVCAAPSPSCSDSESSVENKKNNAAILRYDNDNRGLGQYNFAFEQSDGTKQQQQGELVKKGSDEYLSVKGKYTYIGLDGVTYTVTYTADDDGYKPEIEQGPGGAVPDAVVASLLG
ncbi:unnamed protein product, partial [Iphiclides podalirius]